MHSIQPTAFISYARETAEHIDRVVELADQLRLDGVDCHVDEYEEAPPEGWRLWMERQIKTADFVLIICTSLYRVYFDGEGEPGRGLGVSWERSMITATLYRDANHNEKFIPVLLSTSDRDHIPDILSSATYYDVSQPDGYERLLRRLTGQRRRMKPPVGPVRILPTKPARGTQKQPPFSDQDCHTILDIIAEHTQFLAPGVLPRIGKGTTIEEAVARGISSEAAVNAFRHLSAKGLFHFLGVLGSDELVVNLERLEALRDQPRPIPDQGSPVLEPDAKTSPLFPSFRARFRPNDEAGEPNYYVEVCLKNHGTSSTSSPARLVGLFYTPRNAWDSRGGVWPINIHPDHSAPVTISYLNPNNYGTFLDLLPIKTFPGFHPAGGFEVRFDGGTPLYANSQLLVSTIEVFGPDLIVDWRLDLPEDTYHGSERCARPVDTSLPERYSLRSRLRLVVSNSRQVSTPNGDRLVCDVVMPDYGLSVESSCWAELISQWGSDLTARTLIKEALEPAARKVQALKADALISASTYATSERLRQQSTQALTTIQRLEYQLALETPIRLDDFYSRVLEHYRSLGDTAHVTSVTDEWSKAIGKSLSQVSMPNLDGEIR